MKDVGRIICNKDGYLVVDVGDGAQMTCPTGALEWRLRYGDAHGARMVAASAVDSFSYLLTNCTKNEAWRRIQIMRKAMRENPST
jgi:hypothetical protein